MPASPPPERASGRPPRRRHALSLSIAVHAVAFYGLVHVPWANAPAPRALEAARVIWLTERPDAPQPEPPLPDIFAPPNETAATNAPQPEQPPAAARPPALRKSPPPPRAPQPSAVLPPAREAEPTEHAAPPPSVDWEKERQAAARSVVQQQAEAPRYPSYSFDDLKEQPKPADPFAPATTALVNDGCVIAKTKMQRFAAMMMGRCVRGPRGDMFAAIMPEYLKVRPVCVETRPAAPGSVLADGSEISTVKCELVRKDALEPLPDDILPSDASLARAGAQ